MTRLAIYDRRERALVAAADALLWPIALRRAFHSHDAAAPVADVTVLLNGQVLGTVRVGGGFKEYDLPISAEIAAAAAAAGEPVRITLRTAAWNPRTLLGTPDDRELGVMVDRVAIR